MKRVLVASPQGPRLYELSDDEFRRFNHLLSLAQPVERGAWALRFLGEREPVRTFSPGTQGLPDLGDTQIDRAVGGNFFAPKWGQIKDGREGSIIMDEDHE